MTLGGSTDNTVRDYIFERYDPTVQSFHALGFIRPMIGGEILLTFDKYGEGEIESMDIRSEFYTLMDEQSESNSHTEKFYAVRNRARAEIILPFTFVDEGEIKGIFPQEVT